MCANGICVNMEGKFKCRCNPGFALVVSLILKNFDFMKTRLLELKKCSFSINQGLSLFELLLSAFCKSTYYKS